MISSILGHTLVTFLYQFVEVVLITGNVAVVRDTFRVSLIMLDFDAGLTLNACLFSPGLPQLVDFLVKQPIRLLLELVVGSPMEGKLASLLE